MSDQDPPPQDEPKPEEEADQPSESPPELSESSEPVASSVGGDVLGKGKMAESEEKTMGMLAHILGGVTCVLGPLIIWLIKKDESPFVDDQGKEALNFQITVLIAYVAAGIVGMIPVIGCLSALAIPAVGIASLVFAILGGLESNKGVIYRYPFAFRFIS